MGAIAIIAVVCLAGLVQGTTGFGFGLVAMPLLPLAMGYKDAVVLVVLLTLVVSGLTLFRTRAHFDWRQGRALIAGSIVGTPLGIYLLVHADESLLRHLLGAAMCAFAIKELFLTRRGAGPVPGMFGFPLGMCCGSLDAAFNMGGPPAVAFVYSRPWRREQAVALLQVVFGLNTVLRLGFLAGDGLLTRELLTLGLWALLPLSACILLATHLATRIPHGHLRQAVFVFLGVMGVKYLAWG